MVKKEARSAKVVIAMIVGHFWVICISRGYEKLNF